MLIKVKSLFISDIHLGSSFCQIAKLNSLLKQYEAENIFLIGDIFDGLKIKKGFYWNDDKTLFVQTMLDLSRNGTNVVYLTGNHDDFIRKYDIQNLGSIKICDEYIHEIKDRKLLILHGDYFDTLCNTFGLLYHIGDTLYTFALHVNKFTNYFRRKLGLKYYPISSLLKRKVKSALKFINNFEYAAAKYCVEKECQEIMIGHIHHPELNKEMNGVKYHNTGDFVESCSMIIERYDGELELIFSKP